MSTESDLSNHHFNKKLIEDIQIQYDHIPVAVYLLGANGSGKSTLRNYLNLSDIQTNIDSDLLNKIYQLKNHQHYLLEASKQALQMYAQALDAGLNVCLESTLAGHGTTRRIMRAKKAGYYTLGYFVGLNDVTLNLERIKARVEKGGHDIPEKVVKKRYHESIDNLQFILNQFDVLHVIDNSQDHYALQFSRYQNKPLKQYTNNIVDWAKKLKN